MEWFVWLAVGASLLVLGSYLRSRRRDPPSRAALPSHYNPRHYVADPANVPGWCVECGTENDPEYRYCENCAAKIPRREYAESSRNRWFPRRN